jgi:hypothetical protein
MESKQCVEQMIVSDFKACLDALERRHEDLACEVNGFAQEISGAAAKVDKLESCRI